MYDHAAAITPNDSTDLANFTRAIYVGGAGNIKIDTVNGETVTLNGATAGSVLAVQARRVHSTGTSATNLVALY